MRILFLAFILIFSFQMYSYATVKFPGYGQKGSLGINIGTRATDPASGQKGDIYFNTTINKFKYYNGTTWNEVGSGSGGGGVNYVGMGSAFTTETQSDVDAEVTVGNWVTFDDGAVTSPVDMTGGSTSTLTLSRTTTGGDLVNGTASFKVVKTAADSQGEGVSVSFYVPPGYRGSNAQVTIPFKLISGSIADSNLRVFAYDQTNGAIFFSGATYIRDTGIVIDNVNIPSTAAQVRLGIMFTSTDATAATFSFDDVTMGPPRNIGTSSQPILYGKLVSPVGGGACTWSRTSAAYGSFTVDNDCTFTTTGKAVAPATKIPAIRFPAMEPGHYFFDVRGSFEQNSAANNASFRITDGTNDVGESGLYSTGTAVFVGGILSGDITYETGGDRTFEIQCKQNGVNACEIHLGQIPFSITVYRFPTANDSNYSPNLMSNLWTGYHDAACAWTRSNAAFGDMVANGDISACDLIQRTNTNIGTIAGYGATSGASALPGIIHVPKDIATFEVCANVIVTGTASQYSGFQLLDGATVLDEGQFYSNGYTTLKLCGHVYATNTSSRTYKIYSNGSSGNASYIGGITTNQSISWTIKKLDQSFPRAVFGKPTVQTFTSGSGTYTKPTGASWIRVRMVGGGGGGGGGNNGNPGSDGGDTTFGSSFLVAENGGGGGGSGGAAGTGGAITALPSGAVGVTTGGGYGQTGNGINVGTNTPGGVGGSSCFGGGGGAGVASGAGTNSLVYGAGGGGSGISLSNNWTGGGGGAGACIDAIITNPSATYSYSVGSGGTGGTGGPGGGNGYAGVIIVEEYY